MILSLSMILAVVIGFSIQRASIAPLTENFHGPGREYGFEWQVCVVTTARSGGTPGMTAMKFSSGYLN
jgi:hypothetical protein